MKSIPEGALGQEHPSSGCSETRAVPALEAAGSPDGVDLVDPGGTQDSWAGVTEVAALKPV